MIFYQDDCTTIYHADVLEALRVIPDSSVGLIATSPPYNCGKTYAAHTDTLPWPDYYAWMGRVLDECYRALERGGVIAVNVPGVIRYNHDHPHKRSWSDFDPQRIIRYSNRRVDGAGRLEPLGFRVHEMMRSRDSHMREPVAWIKAASEQNIHAHNTAVGNDSNPYLRGVYEMILIGSKETWVHRGATGRRGKKAMPHMEYYQDVWFVPSTSSADHPAPWPLEIPRRLIRTYVHAQDAVVLDPFCGRGTTLVAACEEGRTNIGIDNARAYCETARAAVRNVKCNL